MVEMPKIKMTLEEYMELDETNQIVELIDGELVMPPQPLDEHQKDSGRIFMFVWKVVSDGELRYAPTGLHIGGHVDGQESPAMQFFEQDTRRYQVFVLGRDG